MNKAVIVSAREQGKKIEERVAKVMTAYSSIRNKTLKKKLGEKTKEYQRAKKMAEESVKKSRTLKITKGTLEKKYKELEKKKKAEVLNDYRNVVTKIKVLEDVESFHVDKDKRIFITTKFLYMKKEGWFRKRKIGRYQIMIDFSKESIKHALRAINIDYSYGAHDHPNLDSSTFCFGNALTVDLEKEFETQDLYEVVVDLIDLIKSPNDNDGFTEWEYFCKNKKKRSEGYSFEKYEQENKIPQRTEVLANEYIISEAMSVAMASNGLIPTDAAEMRFNRRNGYSEMLTTLQDFGLSNAAARHHANIILGITQGERPSGIEARRDEHGIWLYIRYSVEESEGDLVGPGQRLELSRLFVNNAELVNTPPEHQGRFNMRTSRGVFQEEHTQAEDETQLTSPRLNDIARMIDRHLNIDTGVNTTED